jgi:outer membrane protein assembly factor BamD
MVYLRNRLASYDVHVAQFYMRREAYVAAAQRADDVLEQYDGSPQTRDALKIMIAADERLGLKDKAEQARKVYDYNFTDVGVAQYDKPHHWWQIF